MRRILSLVLAVTIIIQMVPETVLASVNSVTDEATNTTDNAEKSLLSTNNSANAPDEEDSATFEEAYILGELTDKRDERTKYFAMSDGTIKACIYPQNVHYQTEDGYEEIDNTLVEANEDGKTYYTNTENSFQVKVPETITDDFIEFSDEEGYVSFKLFGATKSIFGKASVAEI